MLHPSYESLLKAINKSGRRAITLKEFYQGYNATSSSERNVIVRHDVDLDPKIAVEMARVENTFNIRGSYYFRWLTASASEIEKIRALGHEVGLHYETLADYAIRHGIIDKGQIDEVMKTEMRDILRKEIAEFRRRFGVIDTVASHGSRLNRMLELSNYEALLEGQDPGSFGILGAAYGEVMNHAAYCSDIRVDWERVFPLLDSNESIVYILIHPARWFTGRARRRLRRAWWWLERLPYLLRYPGLLNVIFFGPKP